MKIAYFDCPSGISGDMCLGALVDAGAPLAAIAKRLKGLPVRGYRLTQKRVLRAGIAATKVDVIQTGRGKGQRAEGRRWEDIQRIIAKSSLSEIIKQKGLGIFRSLFKAEAEIHGKTYESVHLHELGAIDCLVDIFGTLIGIELLGVEEVYSSPVNLGGGQVNSVHGTLPAPAPATIALLKGAPVYSSGPPRELATPTGAAILRFSCSKFGDIPLFIPEKTGTGAGSRDFKDRPNILRIFVGELLKKEIGETVSVIETNIDDMNPQAYEYLFERLFSAGALDVFMTQTIMKKMRPGVKLSVLCSREIRNDLIHLIFRETTSIGVRYYETSRVTMQRYSRRVRTKYGKVGIKVSSFGDIEKYAPEYEDCKAIAIKSGVSLLQVTDEAKKTAGSKSGKKK